MKRLFILIFSAAVLISACNSNSTTEASTTVRDSVGVITDSTTVYDTLIGVPPRDTVLFGFYQGVVPCPDCQGIRHTLLLKDSGRFRLEEFVMGKDMFPEKIEGRWTRQDDSLRLQANRQIIATYFVGKDTLRLAYRQGRAVVDSLSKNYAIVRHADAAVNPAWKAKFSGGAEFYGIGTEPFWNIEIDHERSISFKLADLPKALVFPAVKPRITKDSIVYVTSLQDAKLEVSIYNDFCSDGMSDNLYEYRVHVRYKGETFKGCGAKR